MTISKFRCQNKNCAWEHRDVMPPSVTVKPCPHCDSESHRIIESSNIDVDNDNVPKLGYTKPKS